MVKDRGTCSPKERRLVCTVFKTSSAPSWMRHGHAYNNCAMQTMKLYIHQRCCWALCAMMVMMVMVIGGGDGDDDVGDEDVRTLA